MSETPSEQDAPRGPSQQQVAGIAEQIGHLAIAAALHEAVGKTDSAAAARVAGQAQLDYVMTLFEMKPRTVNGGD